MTAIDQKFWVGKRVLVTGHTGFKGSWLSIWLQTLGAEVFGFSLPEPVSKPSLFSEANVGIGMTSMAGDVREYQKVRNAISAVKPEIIIHMAAQPLVRCSYNNPIETYSTNVMGTVHMLEAARNIGSVRAFINVTTDKCYENKEWEWGYRENETLGGWDPYSSSKACSELVTSAYRRSFFEVGGGMALASARAGNVVGGGDWSTDRLVPDAFRAFEQNRPVVVRNPDAIRPWQHVLEPLRGYLTLAKGLFEHGKRFSEAWNFGPNDEDARSVKWVVGELANHWGKDAKWELDRAKHPHEAHYLKLDISKVKCQLGWLPMWNISTALQKTTQWHKEWLSGASMRALCEEQIREYELEAHDLCR